MSKREGSRSPGIERKKSRYDKLPEDASIISENDYFLKMNEFQHWLKEEKEKYFDELSGNRARHYFRKFVRHWNSGSLSNKYYRGILAPAAQTSYKWVFAGGVAKSTKELSDRGDSAEGSLGKFTSGRAVGSCIPSESDRQFSREREAELAAMERRSVRRRDRQEQRERIEDQVGPKEVGREGMLDKKQAQRESNRAVADARDDAGMEMDDRDLMGDGDSFQAMIARRDANRKRFEDKKRQERESKIASSTERMSAMREKDKATMDMFKAMAKERFG